MGTGELDLVINIVCFYWNNWCGSTGIEYVNKLCRSIERNLSLPHRFYCFTDKISKKYDAAVVPVRINVRKWPWNFPKLLVYNQTFHQLSGHTLLLDLDVVITGALNDVVNNIFTWTTCAGAYNANRIGGSVTGFIQSQFLEETLWNPIDTLEKRKGLYIRTRGGSERLYYRSRQKENPAFKVNFWQDILPGQIVSFKKDVMKNKEFPENARIVRFHGEPRPHKVKTSWMEKYWR